MAERISAYNVPGCLTFEHGRVPDGRDVPVPPRPAPPTRYHRRVFWAVVVIVALAVLYGALR